MAIKTKRIYEYPNKDDGIRILVDRLWPRGISKDKAKIDIWLKDVAPSNELRKWFAHDETKWDEFKRRYYGELDRNQKLVDLINQELAKETVTLVYAAKDTLSNNAKALQEYLLKKAKSLSVG